MPPDNITEKGLCIPIQYITSQFNFSNNGICVVNFSSFKFAYKI